MTVRTTASLGASLAAFLLLAACARGEDAKPIDNSMVTENAAAAEAMDDIEPTGNSAAAALPTDAWVGKWIGVEGLVLDIQPAGEPGRYMLSVTLLNGTKSYDGAAAGETIRFTRDGRPESIRAATGNETGLKWLADKQNCLMIREGEGFCRDDTPPPAAAQS